MSSTGDASRHAVPPSPSGGLTAPVSGFVFPSPCLSSRLGSPTYYLVWHDNLSYSPAGMAVNPVTGLRVLLEQGPPRHRAVAPSPPHPPRAPPGPPLAPHPAPAPVVFLLLTVVRRMHRRCRLWRSTLLQPQFQFLLPRPPRRPILAPPTLPCFSIVWPGLHVWKRRSQGSTG